MDMRNILLAGLILAAAPAAAQTYLECGFDGGIPQDFTLIDNDGLEPSGSMKNIGFAVGTAWITETPNGGDGPAAASTSWYAEPGRSDDWMITPPVIIADDGAVLRWRAMASDKNHRDGYAVYVSETGGNTIADFDTSRPLFAVGEEEAEWTVRTVSLDAYKGKTVSVRRRGEGDIGAMTKADFIAMGRESLTDPHWPNKAKEGRYNDIRHCIGCLQGCTASTYQGVPLNCVINPELGHEFEYDYTKVKNPKTIYIAGAGIAGMEAARAAAIKGHNVELFEAKDTVGGQFVSAAYPPYKGDYANYTGWLYREIQKYDNIRLHLHTELTREMVLEGKPDKIIVATGAAGIVPKIPGIENPKVVMAEDALLGRKEVGMNVLIAGGGMVGLETAAFFGMQCKSKVTVIEMKEAVATDMEAGIRDDLKTTLRHLFVEILCNTSIAGITDEGALIKQGNDIRLYPCDTVVMAIGTRSNQSLLDELRDCGIEIVVVGDAVKARQITQASREGFVAGLNA